MAPRLARVAAINVQHEQRAVEQTLEAQEGAIISRYDAALRHVLAGKGGAAEASACLWMWLPAFMLPGGRSWI